MKPYPIQKSTSAQQRDALIAAADLTAHERSVLSSQPLETAIAYILNRKTPKASAASKDSSYEETQALAEMRRSFRLDEGQYRAPYKDEHGRLVCPMNTPSAVRAANRRK